MLQAGWITIIALIFQNVLAFLLAWACDREIKLKNWVPADFLSSAYSIRGGGGFGLAVDFGGQLWALKQLAE